MRRLLFILAGGAAALACQKPDAPEPKAEAPAQATAAPAASGDTEAIPAADAMNLPAGLGKLKVPADNPQSEAKIELGHRLFFEKRLSADGSRSCYSCHANEHGTGGSDALAVGVRGKPLPRHSPALFNAGFLPRLGWDGRFGSLEEQTAALFTDGAMGGSQDTLAKKASEIGKLPTYKARFDTAFPGEGATAQTLVRALAAYQRALVCDDTDYDRYAKGERSALSPRQKTGLELFMGKAACVSCHTPPFFSSAFIVRDGTYFNVGVGIEGKQPSQIDAGRKTVTNAERDFAAFKVPSLRHVSKSAPYFHDGSQPTLEQAVRFMASGGFKNDRLTPLMTDKRLDDAEVKAIVEFLSALDCKVALAEPSEAPILHSP